MQRAAMKPPLLPALLLFAAASAHALEPWADEKLPVKDGVELWLDAARQPAAREARRLPAPGGALDVWFDGSGRGRNMAQRVAEAQPRWQRSVGGALVRFDGKDDWLGAGNVGAGLEAVTVFIVAAPRGNAGRYRGLFAASETSRNDYETGLNLDLGGKPTPNFTTLNAEGAGFGGERNLLTTQYDFGTFHVLGLVSAPGPGGVRAFVDGAAQGSRDRAASVMRLDEIAIGARLFTNNAEPLAAQSPFEGDIAEVLVYGRALSDEERSEERRVGKECA